MDSRVCSQKLKITTVWWSDSDISEWRRATEELYRVVNVESGFENKMMTKLSFCSILYICTQKRIWHYFILKTPKTYFLNQLPYGLWATT